MCSYGVVVRFSHFGFFFRKGTKCLEFLQIDADRTNGVYTCLHDSMQIGRRYQ